ncbi:hypothetical protein A2662_04590 [Candidatus Giovannonibacteria bacterium RIFCSPHIGHO2_01_FULL_45_33]|uniref:Transglycosylase SLT domain-containing protein n=1 Tax=Candidatus Giovannonibacteria bacterium RIFCSPLOWO2_01_FULL_45_34 TaxID=1798351 RepID=A0A1F5WZH1_9BACT|nr:MAG: hypothetical protein A2662_04590 [Candidatus Giovannonibacteria bacterium RIFCSPHIGHO2_01_FULL_45_33]OGF69819.1 MAG: hypothetical protein A3C73_03535 [Candidatus Giovannonibacteria bacterium RIFCSPHIGHO2_02_FULL_44_11]OGF81055.1 MAG: hypothetical protein A2930_03305 [Candidatus Giovannonibacteria bacterium RIFCSPLOWO2_01_FULL_45_34]
MKKIVFILALCFLFFVFESKSAAESLIVKKVHEAQELLKDSEVSFETQEIKICSRPKNKKTVCKIESKVVAKLSVLKAWDSGEDKFYDIRIRLPYPLPKSGIVFETLTKDFIVEHVYGRYVGKFAFRASYQGKSVLVLAGKHLWVPPAYGDSQNYNLLNEQAEEIIYTPFADSLYDKDAVLDGARFLKSEVVRALEDLRDKKVVSRALPGKLLADFAPWEYPFNLGINEQMDHQKFDRDHQYTAEEVLIEYAFNREKSFRQAVSVANARGPFQFTDNGNSKALGTYSTVVNAYKDADLTEDFEAGAQDLQNIIKAAICLLDLELSNMSGDAHSLFEQDYRRGAIYPSAAYNGGYGTARALYNWIKKNNYEITFDNFHPSPQAFAYLRTSVRYQNVKRGKKIVRISVKSTKKIVNTETPYYLRKQMYLWKLTDELKGQL